MSKKPKKKRTKKVTKKVSLTATLAGAPTETAQPSRSWLTTLQAAKNLGVFVASAGLLVYFLAFMSEYIRGSILISFSEKKDQATELSISNNWPVDRKIETLRFSLIGDQLITTTAGAPALIDNSGSIYFPDSPFELMQSPAELFSELDGSVIQSGKTINFRLPPLTNSSLLHHKGGIIEARAATKPVFLPFKWLEDALTFFGAMSLPSTQRFLVQDDYWIPVESDFSANPMELSCREKSAEQLSENSPQLKICSAENSELEWGQPPSDIGDATATECSKYPQISSPFTTRTEHNYIVAGKVRGTINKPDGSGKPLILYVWITPGTKVVCEKGRFILFYDSLEAIRYFWKRG